MLTTTVRLLVAACAGSLMLSAQGIAPAQQPKIIDTPELERQQQQQQQKAGQPAAQPDRKSVV